MLVNNVELVEGVEGEVCELEEQGKTVVLVAVDGEYMSSIMCHSIMIEVHVVPQHILSLSPPPPTLPFHPSHLSLVHV